MKLALLSQLLLAATTVTSVLGAAKPFHQTSSKEIAARLRARTLFSGHIWDKDDDDDDHHHNPPAPNPPPPQASPLKPDEPGYCANRKLSADKCCENVSFDRLRKRTSRKTSYNPVNDNCCKGNLVGTPNGCCPAGYSASKGHPKERGYCCASIKSCCATFNNDGTCLSSFDPKDYGFFRRDTIWRNAALTPREYVTSPLKSRALLNVSQGIEYVLGGGTFHFEGQEIHDTMHTSFVKRAVTRAVKYGQAALAHLGDYEISSRAKWILDPEWNPQQQLAMSDSYKINIADGHEIIDGILADPSFTSFQHYWFEVDRESLELIKALLPPPAPVA